MFSAEDQKKLAHWFKQIAELTNECRACGRFDEAFTHPDLVCTPVVVSGQKKDIEHSLYFLVRECRACGYTMLFNAERIGIHHRA